MNKLLTFEISKSDNSLEIHLDRKGLHIFREVLEHFKEERETVVLLSPEWGGESLTNKKQGEQNELLDKVKLFFWPEIGSDSITDIIDT